MWYGLIGTNPCSSANNVAPARVDTPTLPYTRRMWWSHVLGDIPSRRATRLVASPRASRPSTSHSRSESPAGRSAATRSGSFLERERRYRSAGRAGAWCRRLWCRVEADDLVAAQRLQEGLEAAADHAAQDRAVDLHVADAGRARYLRGGGGADETDLDSPYRQLLRHARDVRSAGIASASVELPIRYPEPGYWAPARAHPVNRRERRGRIYMSWPGPPSAPATYPPKQPASSAAAASSRRCGSCPARPPPLPQVPSARMPAPGRGCSPSGRPMSRGWSPKA